MADDDPKPAQPPAPPPAPPRQQPDPGSVVTKKGQGKSSRDPGSQLARKSSPESERRVIHKGWSGKKKR